MTKRKVVTQDGDIITVQRRLPELGESWVYLQFDEPIKPIVNNLGMSWFNKLWDAEYYFTVIN